MRRILLSTAKILISAALLYLALRKVNPSELFSRFTLSSLFWIGMAIAVTFLQIFVGVLRWREISAECGAPLGLGRAMRYNVIGAFFNQTLPSAIGGDAVRLWLVARAGAGWRAATYSIFVDRAIGLVALAILIVASLPWSYSLITDPNGRSALLLLDLAALAGGVGFLIFGALKWSWLKSWWATHHIHACAVIANRVIFNRTRGPRVAILSLVIHVLAVVIAWCVVQSIAAPVNFGQVFLLIPPVMLITLMPISIAGWGVREATMGLAFGFAGLAANEGVNVSLLFGAVSFIVGAFGGLVWIFSAEKAAQGSAPIEVPGDDFRRRSAKCVGADAARPRIGRTAFCLYHLAEHAAAAALRAGPAKRTLLASDPDAAGRGYRGRRGHSAGRCALGRLDPCRDSLAPDRRHCAGRTGRACR